MARIQVDAAFIEKVLTTREGVPFGVSTSEPHRRKTDAGEWVTTARTFRTVTGQNIDWSQFNQGDRIAFAGSERTETREHEGKTHYNLTVRADAVSLAGRRQDTPGSTNTVQTDPWGTPTDPGPETEPWTPDTEVPF